MKDGKKLGKEREEELAERQKRIETRGRYDERFFRHMARIQASGGP